MAIPTSQMQKAISAGIGTKFGFGIKPEQIPFFKPDDETVFNTNPTGEMPIKETISFDEFKSKTQDLSAEDKHRTYLKIRDEKGIEVAGYDKFINTYRKVFAKSKKKKEEQDKEAEETIDTTINSRNELAGEIVGDEKTMDTVDKWLTNQTKWSKYEGDEDFKGIAKDALLNLGPSAWNLTKSIGYVAKNPIDSSKAILGMGLGGITNISEAMEKGVTKYGVNPIREALGLKPEDIENINNDFIKNVGDYTGWETLIQSEEMADTMGGYIKNRYGTKEGFKQAVAEDPAGVISDMAMIISGGASAGAKLTARSASVSSKLNKVATTANKVDNLAMFGIVSKPTKWTSSVLGNTLGWSVERLTRLDSKAGQVIMKTPKLFDDYYKGRKSIGDIREELGKVKDMTSNEIDTLTKKIDINTKVKKQEDAVISKIEKGLKQKEAKINYDLSKIPGIKDVKFNVKGLLDNVDEAINTSNVGKLGENSLKDLKNRIKELSYNKKSLNNLDDIVMENGEWSIKGAKTEDIGFETLQKIKADITEKLNFKEVGTQAPAEGQLKRLYGQITELQETLPGVRDMNKKYAKDITEINEIRKSIYSEPGKIKGNIPSTLRNLTKDTNRFKKEVFKDIDFDKDLTQLDDLLKIKDGIDKQKLPELTSKINEEQLNAVFGDEFVNTVRQATSKQKQAEFIDRLIPEKDFSIGKMTTNLLRYPKELEKTAKMLGKTTEEFTQHLNVAKVVDNIYTVLDSPTGKSLATYLSPGLFGGLGFISGVGTAGILGMGALGFVMANPKLGVNTFKLVGNIKGLKDDTINAITNNLNKGKNLTKDQIKSFIKVVDSDEFKSMIKKEGQNIRKK